MKKWINSPVTTLDIVGATIVWVLGSAFGCYLVSTLTGL